MENHADPISAGSQQNYDDLLEFTSVQAGVPLVLVIVLVAVIIITFLEFSSKAQKTKSGSWDDDYDLQAKTLQHIFTHDLSFYSSKSTAW